MASPAVQTTNSGNRDTLADSHTVNLPASITSGDLLVVFFAHKDTANGASFPAGWAKFGETLNTAGAAAGLSPGYRRADGTEGASITVTTTVTSRMAYTSYRISGAENPSTQAPEVQGTTANNSTAPDPPTITPTGGSKDYLFLAAFASSHGRITSTLPTNYTDNVGAGSDAGTVSHMGVGSGRRALTAASENPGTFATTGTGVEEIAVVTVAIHPAAASSITGSASITQEAQGVSAASTLALSALLNATQAGNTLSAASALAIAGAASIAQAGDTLSAAGSGAAEPIEGALTATQDDNTLSGAGVLPLAGVLSGTQAGNTLTAAGTLPLSGAASITQAGNTVSALGALRIAAAASITQAGNTLSALAGVPWNIVTLTVSSRVLGAVSHIARIMNGIAISARSLGSIAVAPRVMNNISVSMRTLGGLATSRQALSMVTVTSEVL